MSQEKINADVEAYDKELADGGLHEGEARLAKVNDRRAELTKAAKQEKAKLSAAAKASSKAAATAASKAASPAASAANSAAKVAPGLPKDIEEVNRGYYEAVQEDLRSILKELGDDFVAKPPLPIAAADRHEEGGIQDPVSLGILAMYRGELIYLVSNKHALQTFTVVVGAIYQRSCRESSCNPGRLCCWHQHLLGQRIGFVQPRSSIVSAQCRSVGRLLVASVQHGEAGLFAEDAAGHCPSRDVHAGEAVRLAHAHSRRVCPCPVACLRA